MSTITITATDNNGNALFSYSVPFELRMTVRDLLESAFVFNQNTAIPDPFHYTFEYFGYSQFAQFPGYLGYELESINGLQNNNNFFWLLSVNGVQSNTGVDTTEPNLGSNVSLTYTSVTAESLHPRQKVINAIRTQRLARRASGS